MPATENHTPSLLKQFFAQIYPELMRFKRFADIRNLPLPQIDPRLRTFLRYFLPFITVLIVIVIGLFVGSLIVPFFRPRLITPPEIVVTQPTPTSTYQSPFIVTKTAISNFTPDFPDPVPPVFDQSISLDPLPN